MSFTNLEYSDIIFLYGFCNGNESAARREYQARYPQRRIPHRRVFGRTFSRLRAVGSFHASSFVERTLRPAHVANEERVVRLVTNDPSLSTRRIAAIVGMSQTRVWRILRRDGLHPFHLTPVQELVAADYQKRMDFCAWLIENSDRDRLFCRRYSGPMSRSLQKTDVSITTMSIVGQEKTREQHELHPPNTASA